MAIPHPRGLSGHSDADVGLHALTDALLATIAAGDIGTHFLPSDSQWKGADSTIFLAHAVKLLNEQNASIKLIYLAFLCEAPKIGPYREAMQQVISCVTGVSPNRISIKSHNNGKTRLHRPWRRHRGAGAGNSASSRRVELLFMEEYFRDACF